MIPRHVARSTPEGRVRGRGEENTATSLVPPHPSLKSLREAARTCQACPLRARATQTVFGLGSTKAKVMFVGEQPGFDEDRKGKPFVGPAGRVLDKALEQAGIARNEVYVTNVVKHFKWESKGQQHLHKKPNGSEIAACLPWLEAELQVVEPRVLVCLGATAAQALLGREFRVSRQRGTWLDSPWAPQVMATVHPSSILRAPDDAARHEQMAQFVEDLKKVAKAIEGLR